MAKRKQCWYGNYIAREARQILGGMGITGEYSIMSHSMNLESVLRMKAHTIFIYWSPEMDIVWIPAV
jgi:alkylation response protein AidB-like acyl-CoA dehydrogenase